jgi:hypothetical protein
MSKARVQKKKGKERKGKKTKKKEKNILNHEHIFGICNKTFRVFKMFRLVIHQRNSWTVGFAL